MDVISCEGKGVGMGMHLSGGKKKNIMQQRGAGGVIGESKRSRSNATSWMKMDRIRNRDEKREALQLKFFPNEAGER